MFLIQITNHPLTITAHGFFRLDEALTFSVSLNIFRHKLTTQPKNWHFHRLFPQFVAICSFSSNFKWQKHEYVIVIQITFWVQFKSSHYLYILTLVG